MKAIYILIVLVVAASALGCVGNKQTSTNAPVPPVETSVSPAGATVAPTGTPAAPGEDQFGTENDLTMMDSLVADSNADISFSDSI
ncbi:MAG: hypothetical protein O8C66_06135 [Candidatus Methanoperedens sp.]|nr:hypothetical protein [Candidatus Methanoperedens sp.]MCZ7370070.1 hypothetical protein [Candidatus Methanoperedens sp.]